MRNKLLRVANGFNVVGYLLIAVFFASVVVGCIATIVK